MGHDEMTITLLADYKTTAENRQRGLNVTPETMDRYFRNSNYVTNALTTN